MPNDDAGASLKAVPVVRPALLDDVDALFDICLRTADSGRDATTLYSDPKLPGYIWSAPYGVLEPDFAFVLATPERAIGYVVGTPDTDAFEKRLAHDWWPDVRRATAATVPWRGLDAIALSHIATPEKQPDWLLADYPAHLHINILPEAQSMGFGRQLIETELHALRAHGAIGVHLGVGAENERAKAFYWHLGFSEIGVSGGAVLFGIRF